MMESKGNYIIIDGDTYRAQHPYFRALQERYGVEFCLIATKPELSYLTTQLRYLEMLLVDPLQARATPKLSRARYVGIRATNIYISKK